MATQTSIELQTINDHQVVPNPLIPDAALHPSDSKGQIPLASRPASLHDAEPANVKLTTLRAWVVIIQLCGINFISSFSNGILSIALPAISSSLSIPESLQLWPNAVFYLTGGSCLLLAGPVADVIGPRKVNLPGALILAVFILACGFAQTSIQLIMFRALQGIATALVMPTAVSMISTNVEQGRPRNVGFASIFLAMPLGYAIGLVLGGVFENGLGWRAVFYIGGAIGLCLFGIGIWTLPPDQPLGTVRHSVNRLIKEVDWVGACMASASVALFSYVLAMLSADTQRIKDATSISLLIVSILLLPTFAWWMDFQQKRGKPALIPNHIWKNASFTSVCLLVLLANGVINCMELFSSLYFQKVQQLSAIEASIRILPQVIVAVLLNFLSGVFVNKTPIMAAVLSTSALGSIAPLLMAIADPEWSYWYAAFWAQLLTPLAVDILWTVGTLIVSSAFPVKTQALAGAVFTTFGNIGSSVALCTMQVISSSVTANSAYEDKAAPRAINEGYRATFWALFGVMLVTCVIAALGLRKVGKVGVKRD